MKNVYINPYSRLSRSAKAIGEGLDSTVILRSFPNVTWSNKIVINWGSPSLGEARGVNRTINPAALISLAVDKRRFFETVSAAARVPPFTFNAAEAAKWAKDGEVVLARAKTRSSQGRGILFFDTCDLSDFMACSLFTKYVKNIAEFRVHIAFNKIIDEQKKGLRKDAPEDADRRVKNHANGYIFMRQNIEVPEDVRTQAMLAHKALGLDFAAYDVLYNRYYNQAYVLEANTAPGIEGSTVKNYIAAFKEELANVD